MSENDLPESNLREPIEPSAHGIGVFEIIFLALITLSVIGVAITDFSPRLSTYYWFVMLPVFAVGCLIIEWSHARKRGTGSFKILGRQLLIWIGVLLSIGLVYALLSNGRLDYENTGLIILLLLALATYSAGVIVDYRLCLLGISLGLTLLLMSYLEEYIWVMLILGSVGIVVSLIYLSKRVAR